MLGNTELRADVTPTLFTAARQDLTETQKRMLIAKVIEIAVLLVIRNHLYKWKGETYMQTLGVPTGLRLSGVIGRITMDVWLEKMKVILKENNIRTYLIEKYVDDCNTLCENLQLGARWDGDRVTVNQEHVDEDVCSNRSKEEVTMTVWGQIASSIIPGLQFTVDCPANNPNGKVPMLDFQTWKISIEDESNPAMKHEKIMYSFYEKGVANPKVMDRDSAVPHRMMLATMTQEGVRRLINCSQDLPTEEKCHILATYMRKLMKSGYSVSIREEIRRCAVLTYRRKERAQELGVRPIHRPGGFNATQRRRAKMTAKASWFRRSLDPGRLC